MAQPKLGIYYGWYQYVSGHQDEAKGILQACEEALDVSSSPDAGAPSPDGSDPRQEMERRKLKGRAAVMRAFAATYDGDIPAIIRHANLALELLPEDDRTMRGMAAIAMGDAQGFLGDMAAAYRGRRLAAEANEAAGSVFFAIVSNLKVALTLREQGKLRQTQALCERQLEIAAGSGLGQASTMGCLQAVAGEVMAELGDFEAGLAQAQEGVAQTERFADQAMLGWSYLCLLRILHTSGDVAAATELVASIRTAAGERNLPPWISSQAAAWQARLWLETGRLEEAVQWAESRGLLVAGKPQSPPTYHYFSLLDHIVLARLLLAQNRPGEALAHLRELEQAAETGDRLTRVIEILNLQALAFQDMGKGASALDALGRALALGEPHGFCRAFVDEGPATARLLHQVAAQGERQAYARRLLSAFAGAASPQAGTTEDGDPKQGLVEPLSGREIEVLGRIAEGLTNAEIAARLFLSLNTVKSHTRNIYGKLGVNSRTQAVARAQALGLLR
jgi:LuxR family maltose regulon positive regulatory protein